MRSILLWVHSMSPKTCAQRHSTAVLPRSYSFSEIEINNKLAWRQPLIYHILLLLALHRNRQLLPSKALFETPTVVRD